MNIESFLYGVISTTALIVIWTKICDMKDHFDFCKWCLKHKITKSNITKEELDHHHLMWYLSQLEGINILDKDCFDKKENSND